MVVYSCDVSKPVNVSELEPKPAWQRHQPTRTSCSATGAMVALTIGAIVAVDAGGQTWGKQVIGGDGCLVRLESLTYIPSGWGKQVIGGAGCLVSNQRQLVFGFGNEVTVNRLTIRWPAGATQLFEQLPANQEVVIVEGGGFLTLSKPSQE